MPRLLYTARIECDGVISDLLEVEVTQTGKGGQGRFAVPANLAGVIMNAASEATVRTPEGESFQILVSRVLFPECVAEFDTKGPLPRARKVA